VAAHPGRRLRGARLSQVPAAPRVVGKSGAPRTALPGDRRPGPARRPLHRGDRHRAAASRSAQLPGAQRACRHGPDPVHSSLLHGVRRQEQLRGQATLKVSHAMALLELLVANAQRGPLREIDGIAVVVPPSRRAWQRRRRTPYERGRRRFADSVRGSSPLNVTGGAPCALDGEACTVRAVAELASQSSGNRNRNRNATWTLTDGRVFHRTPHPLPPA
jgi:hypothetical protein